MTTVASDGRTMAADTMITYGAVERINTNDPKIFKFGGCLYGFSGRDDMVQQARDWITSGADPKKRPELEEDSVWILKIDKKGKCWAAYETLVFVPRPLPSAIGGGAVVAETAMYLGKSPKEAVQVAIDLTQGSGGPVQVLALHT